MVKLDKENTIQPMIYCHVCNRKFKKIRGLSAHINFIHHLNSKDYYDIYLKKEQDGICENENCNNKTSWHTITKGYQRFCSTFCVNTSKVKRESEKERMLKKHSDEPEWRNKISEFLKEFWNRPENKIKASEHAKSLWQNEKIRNKMILSLKNAASTEEYKKKKSLKGLEVSKEPNWRKKVSEGTIKGWNKVPEKKKSHSDRMKNGGAAYCNFFITNPSKPQVELFRLISQVFPYPIMNYPCGRYSIDIAIPTLNLAFEYDSSYWHKNEEYDKKRQSYIEESGWTVIRYKDRNPLVQELKKLC